MIDNEKIHYRNSESNPALAAKSRGKDCRTLLLSTLRQQSPNGPPRHQRPLPETLPRQRPSRLLPPRRQILVHPSRRRPLPRPLPLRTIQQPLSKNPSSKTRSYGIRPLFHWSKSPSTSYYILLSYAQKHIVKFVRATNMD